MHRTVPTTKNALAPNVNSAEVAKSWSKELELRHGGDLNMVLEQYAKLGN